MREEARRVAGGTALHNFDLRVANTSIFELTPVRRNQIEMKFRCRIAVSRRTLVQKKQRISDMQGVGVEYLVKKLPRVRELRFKFRLYLGTDDIAAAPNTRSDGSAKIRGITAKVPAHLADSLLHDARHGASPPRVEGAHCSEFSIDNQDRHAVGGLDSEQQARGGGDEAIAREKLGR